MTNELASNLITFGDKFEIGELRDTVYHGTLNPLPKDLFAVLRKK